MRILLLALMLLASPAAADAPARRKPVTVTDSAIVLRDPVYFEVNKAAIKPQSHATLDAVAAALRAHPRIRLLEIGVHTDARGSARYNLALSQARADAIRDYLIARQIGAKRLRAKGYGETRPIDRRGTPDAQARNRRVELLIVKAA